MPNSSAFSWNRPNSSYAGAGVTASVDRIVTALRKTARRGGRDRVPRLPRDPKDERGDRQPDERVGDAHPGPYRGGRRDHTERHESVDPGVMAVGNQRRTLEPGAGAEPDSRGQLVADESEQAGDRHRQQV